MRRFHMVFAAAVLAALAATGGYAQKSSGVQVSVSISPAKLAFDGTENVNGGDIVTVALASSDPRHLLAFFIWPAQRVGDFLLDPQGLLFYGQPDKGGSLSRAFVVPPGLEGMLITGRAYATDGYVDLGHSAVISVRLHN